MQETQQVKETSTSMAEMASDSIATVTPAKNTGKDSIGVTVKPSMYKEGTTIIESIKPNVTPFELDATKIVAQETKQSAQEETAPIETKESQSQEPPKKSETEILEDYQKKFSQQFSILAKREKELTEKEKSYKELNAKYKEYEDAKKRALEDPEGYLSAVGLDYNAVTEYYLKGKSPEAVKIRKLETELERIEREKQEEIQKMQSEKEAQELNTKIESAKNYAKKEITEAGSKFETINALGQYDTVFEVIQLAYERDGTVLSNQQAAEQVEAALKEELRQNIEKLKNLSFMREYFYKPDTEKKPEQTQSKTLTNGMSQVTTNSDKARELSRLSKTEDSLREAAKLIKFT